MLSLKNTWGFFPITSTPTSDTGKQLDHDATNYLSRAYNVSMALRIYHYSLVGLGYTKFFGFTQLPIISGCIRMVSSLAVFGAACSLYYKTRSTALTKELFFTSLFQFLRGVLEAFVDYGMYVNLIADIIVTFFPPNGNGKGLVEYEFELEGKNPSNTILMHLAFMQPMLNISIVLSLMKHIEVDEEDNLSVTISGKTYPLYEGNGPLYFQLLSIVKSINMERAPEAEGTREVLYAY